MTRTMLALLVLCVPALARDNGRYNSVAPEVRQWFRAQKSPKTGGLCCNEADGTYAEEDIRNGVYWTRFESTKGEWIPVPADVVIKDPNRNGAAVAWWYFQGGKATDPLLRAGWRDVMGLISRFAIQTLPTVASTVGSRSSRMENGIYMHGARRRASCFARSSALMMRKRLRSNTYGVPSD
jgi:hypothetical protein